MLDSSQNHSSLVGALVNRLNSTSTIAADLQVEVDQATFVIRVEGDEILVTPDRLSHLKILSTNLLRPLLGNSKTLYAFEEALERMGMTVYIYSRFAGILGPKANPLLRRIVYKVSS